MCHRIFDTRGSVISTRGSVISTRGSVISTRGSVMVAHGSAISTDGSITSARENDVILYTKNKKIRPLCVKIRPLLGTFFHAVQACQWEERDPGGYVHSRYKFCHKMDYFKAY